ncbi:T9SS type B sorting domain-containing protein [Cellulophaga baltica]|uniref:T9SS type B sorting domain-containing protein n=1 Tax=Cellulophaga TaxID=104264 RepID=UPI001C0676C8|nr:MULTISPECIES: T9SS type B sorting domain-containing protein [Cellulophaga]MBU2996843.1 T9SS type B sorting domain-containing protein [Cellulophaga baltica]MDO6768240.1 T9SS type B sorting domain-containing protein [Cellulophaga sp. 1_MG-2023]
MKTRLLIFILFISANLVGYAQLSDLHYLPPLKQGGTSNTITNQAVYLSTPETTSFTVNVYQGTNTTAVNTFTIDNSNPAIWTLANSNNNVTLVEDANTGVVLTDSGLRFESTGGEEFYVNYRGSSTPQAASLTSKGRKAMGTSFKWGGVPNIGTNSSLSNTLGIMATEDNTTITLSGYDNDCVFRLGTNSAGITADTYTITLNANESFVFEAYVGSSGTTAQKQGWLGASLESDKDIVISNGAINFGVVSGSASRDAGLDQPVPLENLGKEYVFIRGNGTTNTEFPLIIATQDNTNIFINGSTTPETTIDEGEYYQIPSTYYSSATAGANMLVTTSKDAYAYQCLAGASGQQTIGLNFIAPVNCLLPDSLDNIPSITSMAGTTLTGGLTIIASVSTPDENIIVYEDGVEYTSMPASDAVTGSSDWKTFFIPNLSGDISVTSTGPMAIGFFGYNSNRGVAGYFSGFDTVPEVVLDINGGTVGDCFSGSTIFEASDDNFDAYQWYFDGAIIEGANSFDYAATIAGDYYLRGTKGPCTYDSQTLTIFYCETDIVVNKTVDESEITEGETAIFTIEVESFGFEDVTNLQVTDNIPAGLTLVSGSTTTGTWNGSVWNIGTLEPGEKVTLELEVVGDEIDIDPLINVTNTVTHTQDQVDENITEDIMSASIIVHNDFDNDGVVDIVDVDDDNDGIYDSDECDGSFCFESIINESFEDPDVSDYSLLNESAVPGWLTTATDSRIEIWESGFRGVNSYDGNQHAEINATQYGALYQNLCLTPGTVMNWSFRHRGRDGVDEMQLRIGADLASATVQQTMSSDNTAWILYSGTYTVPVGQTNTVFVFEAVSTASGAAGSGNFVDDVNINIAVAETCVDSDGDGYPNNIDLDSDDDGCTDADEFYKDNNADADDGGEYGSGTPVVDPDTGAVIAASYTYVLAPEIILQNTSEDLGGNDINGTEISLGDTFDYVLRFQNTGDDDATDYTIRDVLPSNVTLDNVDVTLANNSVNYTYDAVNNIITFEIPDDLVEAGDPEYTIRMTVTLSSECSLFVDACSETVENLAYSTYQGVTNTNTFSDEPGSTMTPTCSDEVSVASNSILNDLENCNVARTVQLCGDDATLTAGSGFATYVWAIDSNGNGQIDAGEDAIDDGDSDNDPSTLFITETGNYIVEKSGATDCSDLVELITVELFGETQTNPVLEYFNEVNADTNPDNDLQGEILFCSIDGSEIPQIFLCGENDEALIQLGITDADSIVWQQLDETSCTDIGDDCANTSTSCTWNDLATQNNYSLTDSGKYRVVINYTNGCFSRFYFNVFKNTLDIEYISSDILCETPGNIRITNPSANYGYQLVDTTSDTVVVPFSDGNGPNFDITTSGSYKVQITTLDPTTGDPIENACVFETEEIGIQELEYEVNVDFTTADCSGFGTISIQALNALPNYSYELRLDDGTNSGAGTFFQEMVAVNDNTYTFNSVPAGDYIVITTTDDGCTDTQSITVDEYEDLDLTASVTENITCNSGLITVTPSGGNTATDYEMAIWSKDGVELYASIDDIPDSEKQDTNDFLFLDGTDAGEYVFVLIDASNCSTLSNSVTLIDLGEVVVSATNTDIVCADSSTSTLTITASGGTAPYNYSIDGGTTYQSTNTFSNLGGGTYTISVEDSSGTSTSRCVTTLEYEIDEPYRLTASAAIVEDASCDPTNGALVKILNASGGSGSGTYEYSFDGGSSFSTVNEQNLTAGFYILTVRDNLGCTFDMVINVPSTETDPILDSDVTYDCDGNGTITITTDNSTDFDYTYSIDGIENTPSDSNVFSPYVAGTYNISVGYSSTLSSDQSTILLEYFGSGSTTEIEEIGTGYCYEPQDGTDTDCNLGPAGILVNGEYAVTDVVTNPNTSWRTPNDHSGLVDGRFMAIGVSTSVGNGNILWSRNDLDVLADQDITISFYGYNLLIDSASGNDPEVLIELVDASGTVINSTATTAIPKNTDADDWHLREVTLNPGANTVVGIVLRTNLDSDNGNFLVLDDIQATQAPEVCETTQDLTVVVEADQEFSVAILGSTDPTCNGDSDGSIRFEVENFDTTTGYEYSTDGGTTWIAETSEDFTTPANLADGTYSIIVRKVTDNTCTATSATSVTLIAPTAIIPSLIQTAELTCNSGATLEASASGGTPGYEYQLEDTSANIITPYQTTTIFTVTNAGDYLVRVKDDNDCEALLPTAITVNSPADIEFDLLATSCYEGASDATIEVDITSGNGDYTFRIDGGAWQTPTPSTATKYTFTGLTNGTYTIEVNDGSGCGPVDEIITISPQLTGNAALATDKTCIDDAVINLNITGGDTNYTYEWSNSDAGPWDTTGFLEDTYNTSVAGTYYFRVTDTSSPACIFITNAVEVTDADPPVITNIDITDLSCNGDNTGALDVIIDTSVGLAPYTINVYNDTDSVDYVNQTTSLPAGDYTVRVTDSNACFVEQTVTIDEPLILTPNISHTDITCGGSGTELGSITIDASGGSSTYIYRINNADFSVSESYDTSTGSNDHTFTDLNFGDYTVTVTDINGCQTSSTVAISPSVDVLITASGISGCTIGSGEMLVEADNTSGTTLSGGPYYFAQYPAPTFSASDPDWHLGTLSSNGLPSYNFTGLNPGVTYNFIVHDATSSCEYYQTATTPVATNSNLTSTIDTTTSITCFGSNDGIVEFTIDNYDATSVDYEIYTYPDNNTTGIIGTISTATTGTDIATNLPPSEYYILFTENDGTNTGCVMASDTFVIDQAPTLLEVSASATKNQNCNDDGTITASGNYGVAPYEYQYLTDTATAPTTTDTGWTTSTTYNDVAGDYIVYIKDANDCIQETPVTIDFDIAPSISSIDVVDYCVDEGLYQVEVTLTTTDTATYNLSVNGGALQSSNFVNGVYTVTGLSSSTATQTIEIQDVNGCGNSETFEIASKFQATAQITKLLDCSTSPNAEITITAFDGYGTFEYEVTGPTTTDSQARTALPNPANSIVWDGASTAGTYTVAVYDNNTPACDPIEFIIEIVAQVEPSFTATTTAVSCAGSSDGTITVIESDNGISPLTYTISPASATYNSTINGFAGLPGGTYDVIATGTNGCTTTETVTIDENLAITFDTPVVTQFGCTSDNTSNNAVITLDETSIANGTGTYNRYVFIDDATSTVLQDGTTSSYQYIDLSGGDVIVRVYDDAGCSSEQTVTVNAFDALVDATVSVDEDIDCVNAGEDISIDVTSTYTDFTSTPTNYEFRQLPATTYEAAGDNTFDDLAVGTHTFGVRNITTGCEIYVTHTVEQPNTFDVTVDVISNVVCFGDDGSIEVTFTDATYTGDFEWEVLNTDGTSTTRTDDQGTFTGTGTTATIPVAAGNYIVRVAQAGFPECTQERAFTISTPDAAITLDTIETSNVGCSNSEGTANITPQGGVGPYTIAINYEITSGGTTTSEAQTATEVYANLFEGLVADDYTVTITDALGCVQVFNDIFTLEEPDPLTGTITDTQLECTGDTDGAVSFVLDARNVSPNYSYSLNTYDDAAGTTLLRNSVTQTSPDFNNLGAGFYSISVTDDINCEYETSIVEIVEPTDVDAILITESAISCLDGADLLLIATGGTAPFEWSEDGITFSAMNETNGADTHLFTDMPVGTYSYYVKDDFNCVSIISNELTVSPIEDLTVTLDIAAAKINCAGDDSAVIIAEADGGLGDYEYALFEDASATVEVRANQFSGTFSDLPSGTYYVRVQSRDCEVISEEILIEEPDALVVNYDVTNISCNGEDDGSVVVNLTGGTGDYIYAISPNLNQFDEDNTFEDLEPGDYTVIAQDSLGCYEVIEFTITEPAELEITSTVQDEICFDSSDGSISLAITGGTAPYSTSLNSNEDSDFVQDKVLYENLSAGFHTVYIKDANGCTLNEVVTIEVGVNLNATPEVIYECTGDTPTNSLSITLEDETVSDDVLYALDSTDSAAFVLEPDFTNMTAGSHYIAIAHANGCLQTFDFEVIGYTALTIVATQEDINEITATVSGGKEDYTYYFDGEDNGSDNTFGITRTDTYEVRVVDANGCEAITSIYIEFIDIEIPNFFTPDGDGTNDLWIPKNITQFPDIYIVIFDRYGREVYKLQDNPSGWDGLYQNTNLPTGDYWYLIKLNGEDDDREFISNFTLYR